MTSKCMITGCHRVYSADGIDTRGLCLPCFSRAKTRIAEGSITWERLVELGLCKPTLDPFDAAIANAEEQAATIRRIQCRE